MAIQHKRSDTAAAEPGTADLALGELAVNTHDGRLFLKRSDGVTEEIVEVAMIEDLPDIDHFPTINADNYGDGVDSVPASAVLEGTAKAFVQATGTATIANSYNVASITDNGPGEFNYTLTNAMASAVYVALATAFGSLVLASIQSKATGSFETGTFNTAATRSDRHVGAAIYGDLA